MKSKLSIMPRCLASYCRGVFQIIFWLDCGSLLISLARKATKRNELQVLCTQGSLQGGIEK